MDSNIQKNIDNILNYKIDRTYEYDENKIIQSYYKNRLDMCFQLLKYIQQNKNSQNLREEYAAVMKLYKKIEEEYKNWKSKK